jgi:hypothetical protein
MNLPWLWCCSECGALWVADTDDDRAPQTACPNQPAAHAGAGFAFELAEDDLEQPMEAIAPGSLPDLGFWRTLAVWPVDGAWEQQLRAFPVHTEAQP